MHTSAHRTRRRAANSPRQARRVTVAAASLRAARPRHRPSRPDHQSSGACVRACVRPSHHLNRAACAVLKCMPSPVPRPRPARPSVRPPALPPARPSARLSVRLSIRPFIRPPARSPAHHSVRPPVRSVCVWHAWREWCARVHACMRAHAQGTAAVERPWHSFRQNMLACFMHAWCLCECARVCGWARDHHAPASVWACS